MVAALYKFLPVSLRVEKPFAHPGDEVPNQEEKQGKRESVDRPSATPKKRFHGSDL